MPRSELSIEFAATQATRLGAVLAGIAFVCGFGLLGKRFRNDSGDS